MEVKTLDVANFLARIQKQESTFESLSKFSPTQLKELATCIRHRILEVVSSNGGHLSSTLGAVDLIIGMHLVFDANTNPFIFDVSHQAYAHKLLTGRWNDFSSLRQFGGLSGFCNPKESPSDYFIAGHSSTSISLAVGAAKALALKGSASMPAVELRGAKRQDQRHGNELPEPLFLRFHRDRKSVV